MGVDGQQQIYLQSADHFRVVSFREITDQLDSVVFLLLGEGLIVSGSVRDELLAQLHQPVQIGL